MARSRYEYETSPKKLEPEIPRRKQKRKLKVVEDVPRQDVKISKEQKKRQIKLTLVVIGVFMLLLTISYRNSQINEKFSQVQTLKKELSSLEKENEQLKVNIENSMNLTNIEQSAKELLGMQKLENSQKKYVNIPKEDYVEPSTKEVIVEEETSWWDKLIKFLTEAQ